jgi:O-antigen ligase
MLLEATIETGWPGIAAWLFLLGTAAWKIVATLRRSEGERRAAVAALAAAVAVLVVYGQFSAFFALAPIYLFWNLLGAALSATGGRTTMESTP